MDNLFSDKLKEDVKKIFDKNGGWQDVDGAWQAILDLGYDKWKENGHWSYEKMIEWVGHIYGDVAVYAILMGKLNQQVTNGGWTQYFDNEYGGREPDIELHRKLIALHENLGFSKKKRGNKMLKLLNRTAQISKINSHNHNHRDDDEYYDRSDLISYEESDKKYYKFGDKWIKKLITFFNKEIAS